MSEGHFHEHDHHRELGIAEDCFTISSWQPWVYASTSILVLSLVGLLGILLVPVVNKVFYNHLLQFLVAMAAGSLAGDALMHLLPEALGMHSHESTCRKGVNSDNTNSELNSTSLLNHTHPPHPSSHSPAHNDENQTEAIWKCGVCFVGIYIFFLIERLMEIYREYKRRREASPIKRHNSARHDHCHTHVVGFKFSGSADHCVRTCDAEEDKNGKPLDTDHVVLQTLLEETKGEPVSSLTNGAVVEEKDAHSHGHGHSHSRTASPLPTNMASVVWMVILGDGIHNLIDGLTVGVAFRTVAGGFSTSLAVLLHEIPHELGDFAVLLKAGMSVRLAVFYNLLSSVISFAGMVIGVMIGQSSGSTPTWIFALAAGGFLYIALVDLLPELRPVQARRNESPLFHFLLQNLGVLTGAGIMLLIARFEGEIERTFKS